MSVEKVEKKKTQVKLVFGEVRSYIQMLWKFPVVT